MKRRKAQERDEAVAREQADSRREHLLAELRSHLAPGGQPPEPAEPEPAAPELPAPQAEPPAEAEPAPPVPESNSQ